MPAKDLAQALIGPGTPRRRAWTRELLELLEPLGPLELFQSQKGNLLFLIHGPAEVEGEVESWKAGESCQWAELEGSWRG